MSATPISTAIQSALAARIANSYVSPQEQAERKAYVSLTDSVAGQAHDERAKSSFDVLRTGKGFLIEVAEEKRLQDDIKARLTDVSMLVLEAIGKSQKGASSE